MFRKQVLESKSEWHIKSTKGKLSQTKETTNPTTTKSWEDLKVFKKHKNGSCAGIQKGRETSGIYVQADQHVGPYAMRVLP